MNILVALKDIDFSNSMIEAANKTLKYYYIFPKNIANRAKLKSLLPGIIEDYNNIRPHGQLNHLTPR